MKNKPSTIIENVNVTVDTAVMDYMVDQFLELTDLEFPHPDSIQSMLLEIEHLDLGDKIRSKCMTVTVQVDTNIVQDLDYWANQTVGYLREKVVADTYKWCLVKGGMELMDYWSSHSK